MKLVTAFFLLSSVAQAAPLPQLLREVEEKYAASKTLSADINQVTELAATKQTKKSSGKILIKRPNKVRWETIKPDPNLLVSDGEKYWMYTPPFDEEEPGQLVERKSTDVQSKLLQALLTGKFSIAKDMKIDTIGATEFALIPKKGTAGTVARAEIKIHPIRRTIERVVLKHRGGNRSEITLSDIKLGDPIEDSQFVFKAPPNTERVQ